MKLAVIADYAEENWPSMDLCAGELVKRLPQTVSSTTIRPRMKLRLSRLRLSTGSSASIHILDRLWNRQFDYPKFARRELADHYDFFHVVDHSYAAVVHSLPGTRTGVYCHDLDAFRCLLNPTLERRPFWFRAMAKRILRGMQKAALVFHNSLQTRDELLRHRLVPENRLIHAPLGIAEEFRYDEAIPPSEKIGSLLVELNSRPILMHVGSNIARKRIDLLLDILAAVKRRFPDAALLKVGDAWTEEQRILIDKLGLEASIYFAGKLDRGDLAACYRRADVVVVPSDAEGFGLPVIEAMACGAPVVASDIPALRESGGSAAVFAPVGDIEAWVDRIDHVLCNADSTPTRRERIAWASKFSWSEHARIIAEAYQRLL